ncbi:glycosyltransferase family 4 protein [Pareuzebyella sediminis]|uniref:glycosyltransferase family 4 protein n=1 Tax=Pareuzebyella sediminis TaxID=2607998 RepID=UPI0011EF8DE3|nr:glycosyltransferase family 4 protein [Pareuzebyella sediminis]
MKIDFIISNLGGDGAQRVVCSLANYFANNNNKIRIITYREGDKYQLNEKIQRVRLHKKLFLFDNNLVRLMWHLFHFYWNKKNRPDIISSHLDSIGLVTIPISILFGIKIIVSEHNNHLAEKMTISKWILWNILYRFPNAVTILTKFDFNYFSSKNKKVVVMPNPLSFKPNLKSNLRNNRKIIVAGNLNRYYQKGFDNLMEIIHGIIDKLGDWKFMIVGEGDEGLAYLKQKGKKLNILDKVIFAGYRSDIKQILQTSEIFLLCSRYEGLPMVLMEAASQGIACISYDCVSGPSEIIKNGKSGILVENQNKDEMARSIIALIDDEMLRIKLGRNAAYQSKIFSLNKIGAKWQLLFNEVLER